MNTIPDLKRGKSVQQLIPCASCIPRQCQVSFSLILHKQDLLHLKGHWGSPLEVLGPFSWCLGYKSCRDVYCFCCLCVSFCQWTVFRPDSLRYNKNYAACIICWNARIGSQIVNAEWAYVNNWAKINQSLIIVYNQWSFSGWGWLRKACISNQRAPNW